MLVNLFDAEDIPEPVDPVDPTEGEFFWTDAANGKALLNYRYGGRWHRWALPRDANYYVKLAKDEPVCVAKRATKLVRLEHTLIASGKSPA